jgi:hypothetical protein
MTTLRSVSVWGLLLFCFIGLGCEKKAPNTSAVQTAPDKKESLQEKVDKLQRDLSLLKMQVGSMFEGSVFISTEDKGYSLAQTKYGPFAIVCKKVTPYLDGYKVELQIGNLTSARFNGVKISVAWGIFGGRVDKEMSFTNSFPPGRYTTVELVMTPAKPEDIKVFSVTLDFDQMVLF